MCQMNISSLSCLPIMFLFPLTLTYWMPAIYANIFCTKIRLCLRNICQHFNFFLINHYQWRFAFEYTEIFFTPEANQWRTLHEKYPFSEFFWSVFSRFQSKCQKKWTRKTPNTYTFHAVTGSILLILLICSMDLCHTDLQWKQIKKIQLVNMTWKYQRGWCK